MVASCWGFYSQPPAFNKDFWVLLLVAQRLSPYVEACPVLYELCLLQSCFGRWFGCSVGGGAAGPRWLGPLLVFS